MISSGGYPSINGKKIWLTAIVVFMMLGFLWQTAAKALTERSSLFRDLISSCSVHIWTGADSLLLHGRRRVHASVVWKSFLQMQQWQVLLTWVSVQCSGTCQCQFTSHTHTCVHEQRWTQRWSVRRGCKIDIKWHEALNAFTQSYRSRSVEFSPSMPDFRNHFLIDLTLKPRILSYKHNITFIFCLIGNMYLCFVASE